MVNIPTQASTVQSIEMGEFEQKFYMDRATIAGFLRDLATQIEQGGQVDVSTDTWHVAIAPAEPIEMEIEFEGKPHKKELEIEITLKQRAFLGPTVSGPRVQ